MRTRDAIGIAYTGRRVTYVANTKYRADARFSAILKDLEGTWLKYEARKADMTVRFPESGGTVRVVCPQRKAGLLGEGSDIVLYDELEAADGF